MTSSFMAGWSVRTFRSTWLIETYIDKSRHRKFAACVRGHDDDENEDVGDDDNYDGHVNDGDNHGDNSDVYPLDAERWEDGPPMVFVLLIALSALLLVALTRPRSR